jgi:proteasome accessory factor B
LQSGQKYSADELADMLGVSRRTVFRDLKELSAIGVPYNFDSKNQCYTIDPEFFLPPMDLSLQESLSLLTVVHNAANTVDLPFKNSAKMAALKIANNLPAHIKDYCLGSIENLTVRANAHVPVKAIDHLFSMLQKAVHKKLKVSIKYNSLFDNGTVETVLEPLHLMFHSRAWYVIGQSSLHGEVRTFKLVRIGQAKLTGKFFTRKRKFDIDEYLGRAWSMIPEGRLYNVKLLFSAKVARNVSEVQWHSTQKVTHNADGTATLEFRVDGLNEICWWVLGYGSEVRVLAPKTLRKKIVETAKKMVEVNG